MNMSNQSEDASPSVKSARTDLLKIISTLRTVLSILWHQLAYIFPKMFSAGWIVSPIKVWFLSPKLVSSRLISL